MSTYEKAGITHIHGYETSRTYAKSPFPYTLPTNPSQPQGQPPISTAEFSEPTHTTQMAYLSHQARSPYYQVTNSYLNVGSNNLQVTSYSPMRGPEGSKVYVQITTLTDFTTNELPSYSINFGARKCAANVHKLGQKGAMSSYSISSEVPIFSSTGWQVPKVSLSINVENGNGDAVAKVMVGDFEYVDCDFPNVSSNRMGQDLPKKRKISTNSPVMMNIPERRTSSQQLRSKEEFNYQYSQSEVPSYSYMQSSNFYGPLPPSYNRPAGSYQGQAQSRNMQYDCSGSTSTVTSPKSNAQSPHSENWISSPNMSSSISQSSGISPPNTANHHQSLSAASSPSVLANPPLFRTSTMQQSSNPAASARNGHCNQPFNAYAIYPHKAKLEIMGDLGTMAHNWSEVELEARRRLVLFKRSQSGSTITATFHPTSPEERPQDSICVSCIYWQEKKECFVTSVDTIYLLQKLVAAQFTVEEKNRIRRNLEGFRPLTVSKGKSDSEEFFKVIMAFPNPKPRNIEKDVKVFHWHDLCGALKKIIGKYSASPSSTVPPVPPLLTTANLNGYANNSSTSSLYSHEHNRATPPSLPNTITSTAYPIRVLSPNNHEKALSMPLSIMQSGSHSDLRMAHMPSVQETNNPNQWQNTHQHMPSGQIQVQRSQNLYPRSPWEMENYLDPNSYVLPHISGIANIGNPPMPAYTTSKNVVESNQPDPRPLSLTLKMPLQSKNDSLMQSGTAAL
ncbi:transcriptional regulator protein [Blumeria hordei DH14]|uniref:Transcriptional regulator protein n=1 Tax=Blumeria graminis f. sp. hordei (strain DH14) TaxID=546991 RepID=N1JDR9_BLUG1|nr:transcriptional regulator protein [Blumeria hordei DH14]